jgi:hypothetical protein
MDSDPKYATKRGATNAAKLETKILLADKGGQQIFASQPHELV